MTTAMVVDGRTEATAMHAREAYPALVERLSRLSVQKHFDAYADVPWSHDESRIDPEDPRWERDADDPLGATAWYRALPPARRARIGLHLIACQMKVGVEFESILSRGLFELLSTLAPGVPEARYAYHEVIEEAQHSLMFQEFVARSGTRATGLDPLDAWGARRVPALGRTFPELFFLHVLGGEAPVDHLQRLELKKGARLHPLVRRIMQIHVTEEARHVCFARRFLEERVPRLGALRVAQLRVMAPFVLRETARVMLRPPASFQRAHAIPKATAREAYRTGERYRTLTADGLREVRDLCVDLGIVTPRTVPVWRALGVWGERGSAPASARLLGSAH